jgi:hypothetical protein
MRIGKNNENSKEKLTDTDDCMWKDRTKINPVFCWKNDAVIDSIEKVKSGGGFKGI